MIVSYFDKYIFHRCINISSENKYNLHKFTPNSDPNKSMEYFIEFTINIKKNLDKIKEINNVHS